MSFAISLQSDAASYPELCGNLRKKVCKILSHIVMYIIKGAILHRLQYS
jgi:hypothetical protein